MCCNMQRSEQGYHVCIDVLVRHRGGGLLYGGRGVREREREREEVESTADYNSSDSAVSSTSASHSQSRKADHR